MLTKHFLKSKVTQTKKTAGVPKIMHIPKVVKVNITYFYKYYKPNFFSLNITVFIYYFTYLTEIAKLKNR